MKLSQFVFIIPTNNEKYALYNSFDNSIAVIDDELKTILEKETFSDLPPEHLDTLLEIGVIRTDDADEWKMLEYKKKSLRFAPPKTEVYVIPTLKCNLKCTKCGNYTDTMDTKTAESVVKAIQKETQTRLWTFIAGGEPLLNFDITYTISKTLTEWAQQKNISYINSIITNGTLLTESVIDTLSPYMSSVQVTLEGPARYHDTVRVHKDGTKTFDTIIQTINMLSEKNIHTVINVPLTTENHELVPELIDYLRSIGIAEGGIIHVRFFLSPKNSNGVCVVHSPLCDEGYDKALLLLKTWETAWSRGFRATAKPTQTPYCTGIKERSYIVGPKGYMYKCLTQVGTSEKAGVIKNGVLTSKTNTFYDLMKRDVTSSTECTSCRYAPLCAGGCPVRSKEKYNTYHGPDCGPRKDLFDKRIQLFLRFKYPQHFGADEGTRTPNV